MAEFFAYISRPEVDAKWHMDTGYVPITLAGFALASGQGYYIKNPGADIPFRQLTLTEPTENSMGLRLGNMPEIRVIMQEEMEKASRGNRPPSRRSTVPSSVAMSFCATSSGPTSSRRPLFSPGVSYTDGRQA